MRKPLKLLLLFISLQFLKADEFNEFGLYSDKSKKPNETSPVITKLPLKIKKGARIAYVGNTLLDRSQHFGHFESFLQRYLSTHNLVIRNFSWSADEVDIQPRPDNFASTDQHLLNHKTDIIFAAFGFNESFAGKEKTPDFKLRLKKYIQHTKTRSYNGKKGPKIILISPTPNQNLENTPAADLNNERLLLYTSAMREVAKSEQIGFVDVFSTVYPNESTINGVHLNEEGYRAFGSALFKGIFNESPEPINEELRLAVVEKNKQFFRRYRPLNTFYYTGGRKGRYGYLDFLPAMKNFEIMANNRDQSIWSIAQGKETKLKIDDSNVPDLPETSQSRGGNKWMSAEDELKSFKIDPRFEVNCFASEEDFPDIACPIQIRWDSKGRLWVACSTTYPHIYPGQEPNDKIVILEDTNGDGKADKSNVWADDLHIPLSFEFGNGGVYVSEEPDFTFLKDTNGDGKADFRSRVLTGFGCEDSHHALHDFVWTPDGKLLFRDSIFLNSQIETPYGPIRVKNSGWFLFEPKTQKLQTFGSYPNTNPWGVTFDKWGHHVASHPIFASTFHATNPPYPTQHPRPSGIQAYSGTCGQEFIDWDTFPKEMQGGFVKARYKPTNRIEFHRWINAGDHMQEKYESDIIFSKNLSFIPVDIRFGPKGALYVCDWYNPIKGHAQYSLRDERRDKSSGRIWRITAKDKKLKTHAKIDGSTITELLNNLKRKEYRIRYWTKQEIRKHSKEDVSKELDLWLKTLDENAPNYRHHQLEALWVYSNIGIHNEKLLVDLINCEVPEARAAAARQIRHWPKDMINSAERLISKSSKDPDDIVKLETALTCSWLGTQKSFNTLIELSENDMGKHLNYAVTTALGSESIKMHWSKDNKVVQNILTKAKKRNQLNAGKTTRNATEANFDKQKELKTVNIKCVPEKMIYDITEFTVKRNQPVKLILSNPDLTMHNLVIVKPGALEKVGKAGNEMAKDKNGLKKNYIPNLSEVLWSTPQLKQNTSHTIRFKAPKKSGEYPYVCTFPGHWVIMKGLMKVK
ncbi:MAG: PVC-type heme-binding CxxCH protein [Verrucomicrobiales bacterium]